MTIESNSPGTGYICDSSTCQSPQFYNCTTVPAYPKLDYLMQSKHQIGVVLIALMLVILFWHISNNWAIVQIHKFDVELGQSELADEDEE